MPAEGNGPRTSIFDRVRRGLRGVDHATAPALPLGEALHPATLAAVAVLAINDWLLKPRYGPSLVTGKLSDLAGLAFAPVVLSAAIGLVLHLAARLGAPVDPSLSRRRLALCIAATGAVFTLVKLDPTAARLLAHLLSHLGRPAAIYLDPTDLLCLPALAIARWIGRDELRRVPLGRPAALHHRRRPAAAGLADARWAGAPADHVAALAAAIDAWDPPAIDDLLGATILTGSKMASSAIGPSGARKRS